MQRRLMRMAMPATVLLLGLALAPPLSSGAESTPPTPKPPLAFTGYAPSETETTATVKGGVIPRGADTSVFFQYGPSPAYGLQTPSTPAGAGPQETKAVQALTGLTPNTTYHYRLVAVSAAGTAFGEDKTFTTKKVPLEITIAVAPNPTLFAGRFVVRGTVQGTDAANLWVVLQADPFPYLMGFSNVGMARQADSAGNFSIPMSYLAQSSRLRVAALNSPGVVSPPVSELVRVRVSFHARHSARDGYFKLYGSVSPAQAGALVSFQWIRHGHRPVSVGRTIAHPESTRSSRFSRVVAIHHKGRYRAFVHVSSGKLLPNYSGSVHVG